MDAQFRTESYSPDNLIAGHKPPAKAIPIILNSGESVVRGEVLGEITASGKFAAADDAATDGSQTCRAIAAAAIDATGGDAKGLAYVEGEFNQDMVTLGGTLTVAVAKQQLKDFNVYLVDPVTATPA